MKKLLIVGLTASVLVFTAQAVSVNWSGGAGSTFTGYGGDMIALFRTTDPSSTPTLGLSGGDLTITGGFVLLGGTFNGGAAQTINQTEGGNWAAANHITVLNGASFGTGNFAGLPSATYPASVASTVSGASGKMDYYFVVFNNATVANATQYQMGSVLNVGPTLAGSSWTLTTAPAGLGAVTPIPEPASMALFGLGAVVLGLRRRFQKKA